MQRKNQPSIGQFDIFNTVHKIEEIVRPPDVIESEGLKVIHFAISEEDKKIPGYLDTVIKQARTLQPEVKSRGKPPWMTAEWQAKRRKAKEKR